MIDRNQNNHLEMLSGIALSGGHFPWARVPISDAQGENGFNISNPLEGFQRASVSAAHRRNQVAGNANKASRAEGQLRRVLPRIDLSELESYITKPPTNPLDARILGLLDRMVRKRKQRDEDQEIKLSEQERVHKGKAHAGDRNSAAMDLAHQLILPLSNENLAQWEGYIHRKVSAQGPAHVWFKALRGFVDRIGGNRRYHELAELERATLNSIVDKIVTA